MLRPFSILYLLPLLLVAISSHAENLIPDASNACMLPKGTSAISDLAKFKASTEHAEREAELKRRIQAVDEKMGIVSAKIEQKRNLAVRKAQLLFNGGRTNVLYQQLEPLYRDVNLAYLLYHKYSAIDRELGEMIRSLEANRSAAGTPLSDRTRAVKLALEGAGIRISGGAQSELEVLEALQSKTREEIESSLKTIAINREEFEGTRGLLYSYTKNPTTANKANELLGMLSPQHLFRSSFPESELAGLAVPTSAELKKLIADHKEIHFWYLERILASERLAFLKRFFRFSPSKSTVRAFAGFVNRWLSKNSGTPLVRNAAQATDPGATTPDTTTNPDSFVVTAPQDVAPPSAPQIIDQGNTSEVLTPPAATTTVATTPETSPDSNDPLTSPTPGPGVVASPTPAVIVSATPVPTPVDDDGSTPEGRLLGLKDKLLALTTELAINGNIDDYSDKIQIIVNGNGTAAEKASLLDDFAAGTNGQFMLTFKLMRSYRTTWNDIMNYAKADSDPSLYALMQQAEQDSVGMDTINIQFRDRSKRLGNLIADLLIYVGSTYELHALYHADATQNVILAIKHILGISKTTPRETNRSVASTGVQAKGALKRNPDLRVFPNHWTEWERNAVLEVMNAAMDDFLKEHPEMKRDEDQRPSSPSKK